MADECGRSIRAYCMMTVVLGETDAEAEANPPLCRGARRRALYGMMRAYGFLDSEIGKENDFTRKAARASCRPMSMGRLRP
jgi:pyrimidine oxygenase